MGKERLKGAKASISHLFFVDDYMLFREASRSRMKVLRGILGEYEKSSGQLHELSEVHSILQL